MTNKTALSPSESSLFSPAPGYVILKPWIRQAGSITLTENFQQADQISEVVAVGDDEQSLYDPTIYNRATCHVGDIVWHSTFGETYTHFDTSIKYTAVRFSDIKAILNVK